MANYFIIGGDGKEYGPVTEADVHLWIAESRLNAQSLAKSESDAEFRPLGAFPEFAEALGEKIPAPIAPLKSSASSEFLERDYELDLGGCISRGWTLLKENFSPIFLGTLLASLAFATALVFFTIISFPLNVVIGHSSIFIKVLYGYFLTAVFSPIIGPLMGGIYLICIKAIRGNQVGAGDVFIGFKKSFFQLSLASAAVGLIVQACNIPFKFAWLVKVGPILQQLQGIQAMNPADMQALLQQLAAAFIAILPLFLICLVPMIYLQTCFLFSIPLVIDKELDFMGAMKLSWRKVNQHWWQVFGLSILAGLVSLLGVFACGVGLLFSIPVGLAALMIAYETIFGETKA